MIKLPKQVNHGTREGPNKGIWPAGDYKLGVDIPERIAYYFCSQGWAVPTEGEFEGEIEPPPASVTIQPDNVKHKTG